MKTNSIFLLLFVNSILINLNAQKLNDRYYHLIGEASDKTSILADITIAGGRVEGICTISNDQITNKSTSFHVSGRCDENLKSITFKESDNPEGSWFSLVMDKVGKFNGIWKPSNRQDSVKCQLMEKYPEGSIQFLTYSKALSHTLFPMLKESPRASYRIVIAEAEKGAGLPALDSVNLRMLDLFFHREKAGERFDSIIKKESDRYFAQYIEQNTDNYTVTDKSNTFCWDKHQTVCVYHNARNILSFGVKNYAFSGSGKGMTVKKYANLSLKDGTSITLEDCFSPGYEPTLSHLIVNEIKRKYLGDVSGSLTEAGFYREEIEPTENFYITANSFVFVYNSYEIATAEVGAVEVVISFSQMSDFLLSRN